MWLIDVNGREVGSTNSTLEERARLDFTDRAYFQQAMRTRSLALSEPIQSRVHGHWVIVLARPLLSESGDLRGVIALSIPLVFVQELLRQTPLPEGATITVYSAGGMVIAGSGASAHRIGQHFSQSPELGMTPERLTAVADGGIANALPGRYQVTPKRAPWLVVADMRNTRAGAALTPLFVDNFSVAATALALALLLAWMVSRRITQPLRQLGEGARRIAAGELDVRLSVAGIAELRSLASEFNGMADALVKQQRRQHESEERFRSLTKLSSDWYWEQDEHYRFTSLAGIEQTGTGSGPVPSALPLASAG